MLPTEPNSDGTNRKEPSGAERHSPALVAASLILLALLVWALQPRGPRFTPAPLEPLAAGCPPVRGDFVPSNITELPDLKPDELPATVRPRVLYRLNMEPCSCGCGQSIAACRLNQPECRTSARLAQSIVSDETSPAAGSHR